MFNKGNCPLRTAAESLFKHAPDVAGGDQPQAENPACRFCFIGISANCVPKNTLQKIAA